MVHWPDVLWWGFVACQIIAPIPYLVWVWRRTGSWRRLALGAFVIFPAISFWLGGMLGMTFALFRAIVWDEDLSAEGTGAADAQAVGVWFTMFGCCGVSSNFFGVLLSVPLFAVWRLVHRKSFASVAGRRE